MHSPKSSIYVWKSVLSKHSFENHAGLLTDLKLDLGAGALVAGAVVLVAGCVLGNAACRRTLLSGLTF